VKRLIAFLLLIAFVLVACSKTDETAGTGNDTTNPIATTGSTKPTTGEPDNTAEKGSTTNEPNAKGPDEPLKSAPEKNQPHATGSTVKEPTTSADNDYVGQYKASRGVGEDWVMYMLDMNPTGDCLVKVMAANGKAEERKGKWKQAGGMAMIEWPGETPMVLQLKGSEMTATEFDKKNWPFTRLIFYKRSSPG